MPTPARRPHCPSRRHFLGDAAFGLGGLALAHAAKVAGAGDAAPVKPPLIERTYDLAPKPPPAPARADAMISLFMGGGPSHLDLFDPKPLLKKYHGKLFPRDDIDFDNAGGASKQVMASPFAFTRRGESGTAFSELLPHTGAVADDLLLVRGMNLPGIRNHVAGMRALDTGRGQTLGRPSLGSWLTYALGSESAELPAFVAMPIYSPPPDAPYWNSGFLPSLYQGTVVRDVAPRVLNLDPPPRLAGAPQRRGLELLAELNRLHLAGRPGEDDLAARMASYELAANMQSAAAAALDLSRETAETHALYGLGSDGERGGVDRRFAEACLIARRLVERGVRFVQIWYYGWDHHDRLETRVAKSARGVDRPSAALVTDLKRRGMLDRTLVHWGGEMGRLPVIQFAGDAKPPGRDHNTDGFSMWLAGGGVRAGAVHGSTDEFGHRAVDVGAGAPTTHVDYHRTLLHLFGLDAEALAHRTGGRDETLADGQAGRVVGEWLA